jgi:hypothetical protein
MKYYISTTEFNCGIDLHARQMYVCLMDQKGRKLVHTNIQTSWSPSSGPTVFILRKFLDRCLALDQATGKSGEVQGIRAALRQTRSSPHRPVTL